MVTPTQHKIYEFIKKFIAQHGHSPSFTEIAKGIGVSPKSKSMISRYIQSLADSDLLEVTPGKYRQVRLKEPDRPTLPLVGSIAAGRPIEALAVNEQLDLFELFLDRSKRQERYALQVKGDSMIDEGIWDGDIVLCEPRTTARNGEIVVALIDNQEATLKRIEQHKDGTITLWPANPNLKPMQYAANRVRIQGVFVGLLRLQRKAHHVY